MKVLSLASAILLLTGLSAAQGSDAHSGVASQFESAASAERAEELSKKGTSFTKADDEVMIGHAIEAVLNVEAPNLQAGLVSKVKVFEGSSSYNAPAFYDERGRYYEAHVSHNFYRLYEAYARGVNQAVCKIEGDGSRAARTLRIKCLKANGTRVLPRIDISVEGDKTSPLFGEIRTRMKVGSQLILRTYQPGNLINGKVTYTVETMRLPDHGDQF